MFRKIWFQEHDCEGLLNRTEQSSLQVFTEKVCHEAIHLRSPGGEEL